MHKSNASNAQLVGQKVGNHLRNPPAAPLNTTSMTAGTPSIMTQGTIYRLHSA